MAAFVILETGEVRKPYFEFRNYPEVQAGETLVGTPTVTMESGSLTLGTPTLSGTRVLVQVSGQAANAEYLLSCTVQTSGGAILRMRKRKLVCRA